MGLPKPLKNILDPVIQTFDKFSKDDAFTWAAALSYYTVFSLPPILLVILTITGIFFTERGMDDAIFNEIGDLIGEQSAAQLSETVNSLGIFDEVGWASIIGIVGTLLTATTVFMTLQKAFNHVFKVKPKPDRAGLLKMIRDRLLSFSVLLGIAFILLVSLIIDALITGFGDILAQRFPSISVVVVKIFSDLIPFVIITLLFMVLFKYLPDIKIRWKYTLQGALITALLFTFGKTVIGTFIGNSKNASLYDAAESVLAIMLWVFYASLIIILGAVITARIVDKKSEIGIEPASYAIKYEEQRVEVGKK